jgi:putative ABC transport system ATP-binding protein
MTEVAASGGPVVETHGLRKTFESEGAPVRALRGVDFTMTPGEFVAVMGPSGCGKSTLLNIVAGLDTPTDGEVSLAGEALVGRSEDELAIMRRRHIGIVFQFFNLLEGMSVLENVTLPAVIAGAPRKRAETRARDLLDLLGLADKAKNAPGVLSGGQQQRLAIARALANEPTLLLADEPTGALDSEGGHEVLELFRRLHAGGQTILMVTHDDEVAAAADRIVRMRDGRIESEAEEAAAAAASTSLYRGARSGRSSHTCPRRAPRPLVPRRGHVRGPGGARRRQPRGRNPCAAGGAYAPGRRPTIGVTVAARLDDIEPLELASIRDDVRERPP